ncbi:MAG: four helix bundle protein [Candidatus Doudnabacteria bacterium]|nr:four helix bundle protein [Candidatus Doudnabacteria bacterium]
MKVESYKELIVWKKSLDLVEEVFKLTASFPQSEAYGLSNQMRRAAVAIPSNRAEGAGRQYRREFARFVYIANGSAKELETQLIIVQRLKFAGQPEFNRVHSLLVEIMKMLSSLCSKLSTVN